MMKKTIYSLILLILTSKLVSAAHYIVGESNDALDGTSSNGLTVTLWNPENGKNDNTTDIIGTTGNSGRSRTFMIDCELLQLPCQIGDNITVQINESGYYSNKLNITITGAGYDLTPSNLTLNSPVEIQVTTVEDDLTSPPDEINLLPAQTKQITCTATLKDYDGEDEISSASGVFFDNTLSSQSASDDNNEHYTNSSCYLNKSYGDSTELLAICSMDIEYYANPGTWNCTINITSNTSDISIASDTTLINELLGIGVNGPISFGLFNALEVTDEVPINVTNYGNIKINLSLSTYAQNEGDGYAMNCTNGFIDVFYQKYNISSSTTGQLSLSEFEQTYKNSSSTDVVEFFNLDRRLNDITNEAIKLTYWRIFVPKGVGGTCTGNTVFGATKAPATL